ncbi:MAG TPA: M20/M25/M40 family metallo-hydrolase [Pyrinomonadaceae bacterium]|jgi:hypothetical protein
MRRKLLHLSLIALIAASAATAQQKQADAPAPSVERLRAHVTHLASEKLEGRRTGSRGADLAAEYIAREFARYHLRRSVGVDLPGMSILEADSPRRYMQEFSYVAGVELGQGNALTVKAKTGGAVTTLRVGEDWMPLGFSSNSKIGDASVAFVNYGIAAKELSQDDYAGVDVRDKIVIALDGTPDGDHPHGKFARYGEARWKASAARDRGAKALILLSHKAKFSDDRLSELHYDNTGEAGLPVIVLSKPAAYRLLATVHAVGQSLTCGSSTTKPDGTVVTPCGDLKIIKNVDGSYTVELPDGKIAPLGPNGTVNVNRFVGPKEFEKFSWSLSTEVLRLGAAATNVVGILEGSDPKLKDEAIVIGAHYDHLGRGGEGSRAAREGEVHHGADDNASGVAGMLELARIFSTEHARPRRTIIFIAFSGEEEGLLGSSFYVNHPIRPLAQTVAMINLDMIGRLKENKLIVGGVGTAAEWRTIIEKSNLSLSSARQRGASGGLGEVESMPRPLTITLNKDGYGPSDHSSFYSKQVPVLFFWTGTHEDYHKPSDTADKINYADEARILSFVAKIISSVDDSERRPTYAVARSEQAGRSMSFRVYLGTIPNYSDSATGLVLDGVREGSPAAKAGLKAGDRIIRMAGHEVRNVHDYTYALGEMKAGQEYEVEVVRPVGQTLKLKITPAERK